MISPIKKRIGYFNVDYTLEELKNIKYALDQSAIVAITDKRGTITFVNDHFCEVSKYSREDLIGKNHRILNSGIHPKSFFQEMWKTISAGDTWKGDVCNRTKDNQLYWVQTTIVPFLTEQGRPYQYIAIRVDITAQKSMKKIQYLAYHDELTGLPNIRRFNERFEERLLKDCFGKFGIFFIDVDDFKKINDSFGHSVGDQFLVESSNRFRRIIVEGVSIYRLHGDEFVIQLDYKEEIEVPQFAHSIIKIFSEPFSIEGHEFFVNISIGISLFPKDGNIAKNLFKKADTAMLSAKALIGCNYLLYESSMDRDYEELLLLENKLRKKLAKMTSNYIINPKYMRILGN